MLLWLYTYSSDSNLPYLFTLPESNLPPFPCLPPLPTSLIPSRMAIIRCCFDQNNMNSMALFRLLQYGPNNIKKVQMMAECACSPLRKPVKPRLAGLACWVLQESLSSREAWVKRFSLNIRLSDNERSRSDPIDCWVVMSTRTATRHIL